MATNKTKINQNDDSAENAASLELEKEKMRAAQQAADSSYNTNSGIPKVTTGDIAGEKEHVIDLSQKEVNRNDLEDLAIVTGEDMNSPYVSEHIKILAFMEEPVTFQVALTSNSEDSPALYPSVNGVKKEVRRGVPVTLPRKFLNVLIGTVSTVETKQYKDDRGVDQTNIVKNTMPSCPISIINDPSGEYGLKWFQYTQVYGG